MLKILHLLYAGNTGGIEKLCKDIGLHTGKMEHHFLFAHTGGKLYEEMTAAGLSTYCYSYGNKDIFPMRKEIKRLISELGIDVVMIHHPAPLFWLACMPLMKKKGGARFLVYAHNNYGELIKNSSWKRFLYNRLLKKSAGVIAISEFVKKTLTDNSGVSEDKVHVVYNGVHAEDYNMVNSVKVDNQIRLLFIGRLIEKKGVQVLLEALNLIKGEKGIRLSVVGDGPYKPVLEDYVKANGLEDLVTFHGEKRDVIPFMQDADVFVHPAIWEEGFGITLIEAMSAGLPCVAFDRGALSEIIVQQKTGYLIDEISAEKLSDTILKLRDMEKEPFSEMKLFSKERAKDFSMEKLSDRLVTVVKECMDEKQVF